MEKVLTTKKSPKSKKRGLPCSITPKTAQKTVYRGYEGLFWYEKAEVSRKM